MRARFKVELRGEPPPSETALERNPETFSEKLLEFGAIDPLLGANSSVAWVEAEFTVEARSEQEAVGEAYRIVMSAIAGEALYLALLGREESLVGA